MVGHRIVPSELLAEILSGRKIVVYPLLGVEPPARQDLRLPANGAVEGQVEVQLADHLSRDRKERTTVQPAGDAIEMLVQIGDEHMAKDLPRVGDRRSAVVVQKHVRRGIPGPVSASLASRKCSKQQHDTTHLSP